MQANLKRPFIVQGILGLIAVIGFAVYGQFLSALYGMMIGFANIGLLVLTFKKANSKAAADPQGGILVLYMSAVIRFVLLAVLFVIGLALLKLDPLAVVITFVVMTLGQMFNLQGKRRLTD
ncbi:ATP synthase subunit I [Thiomicrospira microaerophila]|uniref:ATP synthase subunit I n=1 Tax=Thiomicrospira microaerophila TaxID=406020 RepID=UPI00200FC2FB|nr:ATP synthase subunit I [Thiomicrospira microaerophila]UQB42160.1 ATP synthase subunit I [Thiomicrospira microaerophila]